MRLGEDDLARIEAAIRAAEQNTAGEIVVVISRQAASYRSASLAATLLAALLVPGFLVLLTHWTPATILAAQAGVSLLVLAGTQGTWVRGRLLPAVIRRRRARDAAERAFASCGLGRTRDRTGILLYVSLFERYVDVIGDKAISAILPDETWRGLVADLVVASQRNGIAQAVAETVGEMGRILAEHLPPEMPARNDLPNRVVLL